MAINESECGLGSPRTRQDACAPTAEAVAHRQPRVELRCPDSWPVGSEHPARSAESTEYLPVSSPAATQSASAYSSADCRAAPAAARWSSAGPAPALTKSDDQSNQADRCAE